MKRCHILHARYTSISRLLIFHHNDVEIDTTRNGHRIDDQCVMLRELIPLSYNFSHNGDKACNICN